MSPCSWLASLLPRSLVFCCAQRVFSYAATQTPQGGPLLAGDALHHWRKLIEYHQHR